MLTLNYNTLTFNNINAFKKLISRLPKSRLIVLILIASYFTHTLKDNKFLMLLQFVFNGIRSNSCNSYFYEDI